MSTTPIITKSTTDRRNPWRVSYVIKFTNRRLVRQGGAPYDDTRRNTATFPTRKRAQAYVDEWIAKGGTIGATGNLVRDDRGL